MILASLQKNDSSGRQGKVSNGSIVIVSTKYYGVSFSS